MAERAQAVLSTMEPGQSAGLSISQRGEKYFIMYEGTRLGKLSARGEKTYRNLLKQGYTADRLLFLAAIRRDGSRESAEFQRLRDIDTWYTGPYQMILTKHQ